MRRTCAYLANVPSSVSVTECTTCGGDFGSVAARDKAVTCEVGWRRRLETSRIISNHPTFLENGIWKIGNLEMEIFHPNFFLEYFFFPARTLFFCAGQKSLGRERKPCRAFTPIAP